MTDRDEFTNTTKTLLAKRVAFRCSMCPRLTIGPAKGHKGVINLGVAAHITAAAKGGPRYDPMLTKDERRAYSNGLWCCLVHGKQIDSDADHFTVEDLRKCKNNAEEATFMECSFDIRPSPPPLKIELDPDSIKQLGFLQEPDIENLTKRVRKAAINDIQCFKNRSLKNHVVHLNLRLIGHEGPEFNIIQCAKGLEAIGEISIVAQPGMGKTTTLIQLTDAILASNNRVAIFIPLGEWSSQSGPIFESLIHRSAFRNIAEKDFLFLAAQGRLTLILDAWNELNSSSRIRVIRQVEQLRREYPLLNLVICTRKQKLDTPIFGRMIEIQQLSENQQLEIARTTQGSKGEELVYQAIQTRGLAELISIPLYLKALLSCASNKIMPTTKEELLRLFVKEHESLPENAEVMRTHVQGLQAEILTALAIDATISGCTSISENNARRTVSTIGETLKNDGQISARFEPSPTLEILVNHHLLIRLSPDSLSFQHEQFQEWYASFEVQRLVINAAKGCSESHKNLRFNIFDVPAWEEAILFCCERLSRASSEGAKAVSVAILIALSIDPMLAAEMISRSSSDAWDEISDAILAFTNRWHIDGKVDRALRFMITTGKSDFAPHVWHYIANPDSQICFSAFHSIEQFNLAVLGDDLQEKVSKFSEEMRERILEIFIFNCGIDGIKLAVERAKIDASPKIQFAVIEALQFKGANRFVEEILKSANPMTWKLFATNGYTNKIVAPEIVERLRKERAAVNVAISQSPLRHLTFLCKSNENERQAQKAIEAIITSTNFPVEEKSAASVLAEANKKQSDAVISGLVIRLMNGLVIPRHSKELLIDAPLIEEEWLGILITNLESPSEIADAAVNFAGPKTLSRLIGKLIGLKNASEIQRKMYYRGRDLISLSRQDVFAEAWLAQSKTKDSEKIAILADLIAFHGYTKNSALLLQPKKPLQGRMIKALRRHAKSLLESPKSNRSQLAELSRALKRMPSSELTNVLGQLAAEDSLRWHRARENHAKGLKQADAYTNYSGDHFRALAAIGDDESIRLLTQYLTGLQSGYEAALALRQIWNTQANVHSDSQLLINSDFSVVKLNRTKRNVKSSTIAENIFKAIEQSIDLTLTEEEQRHLLKLAEVAFSMPYINKESLIKKLLSFKLPLEDQCRFLTALVLAGEILNADLIMQGIASFFEEAKVAPWKLQENNLWFIKNCLDLLPFSDRPSAILDALALFPKRLPPSGIRGVLSSLGHSSSPEAEYILVELVKKDPLIFYEDEWSTAMLLQNTESAFFTILEITSNSQVYINQKNGFEHWLLSKLARFANTFPGLRVELLRRYQDSTYNSQHSIIEKILAEVPDEDVIVALVESYICRDKRIDGLISSAIKEVVLGQRQSEQFPGAFHFYGLAIPKLRKRLFALIGKKQSHIAAAALTLIDEIRDEYGRASSEPRHPDIETNLSWPLEAERL